MNPYGMNMGMNMNYNNNMANNMMYQGSQDMRMGQM